VTTASADTLYAVVPRGIDDPARPSGGNVYDRRVLRGLAGRGRRVLELPVAGSWPAPDASDLHELDVLLVGIPPGSVVLIDGLIASAAAAVLPRYADRLGLVVLVHLPIGPDRGEGLVLGSAAAVVTTSAWARDRLRDWYGVRRVAVAAPGVDRVELGPPLQGGTRGGTALLCVAAVHPGKGHDLLLEALASLGDRAWTLTCVGSLEVDPDHASALQAQVYARSWERRVLFTGPLIGDALAVAYDGADLLVLPSRFESYGMVVTEAIAHGLPVVATSVGGVPEALGLQAGPTRTDETPGLLVPPDDPPALASALCAWLDDSGLRDRLAHAAATRRPALRSWDDTVADVEAVLDAVGTRPRAVASR
jgi:glycosyltransferase involved in cell wall biosynthesis